MHMARGAKRGGALSETRSTAAYRESSVSSARTTPLRSV